MSLRNGGKYGALGMKFPAFDFGSTGCPVIFTDSRVSGLADVRSCGSTSFLTITLQSDGFVHGVVGALTNMSARLPAASKKGWFTWL